MAIKRQQNWLGQQRVDVADLRSVESAVSNDFDILGGKVMSGRAPMVMRGLTISTVAAAGNASDSLQISVAGALLMHFGASESGTVFSVDDNQPAEVLSANNGKVSGSFTAGSTNYIGLDLRRSADATTTDLKQFLDAGSNTEIPKSVPTARTLQYQILISTIPFSVSSNICPIAKVVTDSSNLVLTITDARPMMFRLAVGGDNPNSLSSYAWRDAGRREGNVTFNPPTFNVDPFSKGDKDILSLKEWMDAMMSILWEAKSGEFWYSPTARDGAKMMFGSPVFVATGDNFIWTGGSNTIQWQSLSIAFENSTGFYNVIQDGSAVMASDGMCLYVDLQRGTNGATIVPAVGNLTSLGTPNIPGSRYIIAWRNNSLIHIRDKAYEVGRNFPIATTTTTGDVKLSRTASTPSTPIVISDGGGTIVPVSVSSTPGIDGLIVTGGASSNASGLGGNGLTITGGAGTAGNGAGGIGASVLGGAKTGSGAGGDGIHGTGANGFNLGGYGGVFAGGTAASQPGLGINATGGNGTSNSQGGHGGNFLAGNGAGSGIGGNGIVTLGGTGAVGGGFGIVAQGQQQGAGGSFLGGSTNGHGVVSLGVAKGVGVKGTGGSTAPAVLGDSSGGYFIGGAAGGAGITAIGAGGGSGAYIAGQAGGGGFGLQVDGSADQSGNGIGMQVVGYGTGVGGSATAAGTGAFGWGAYAGGGNGVGLDAAGHGTGSGITSLGGNSAGAGITATGGFTGYGVVGIGGNGGHGGSFTGQGSSTHGLHATGGTGAGHGIVAAGGGSGTGITATGGATGSGVVGSGGATSGFGGDFTGTGAVGDVKLHSNPAATAGFTNVLSAKNVCKAWVKFHTDGSTTCIMDDGFNVASVTTDQGAKFTVNLANGITLAGGFNHSVSNVFTDSGEIWCQDTTNPTSSTALRYRMVAHWNGSAYVTPTSPMSASNVYAYVIIFGTQ